MNISTLNLNSIAANTSKPAPQPSTPANTTAGTAPAATVEISQAAQKAAANAPKTGLRPDNIIWGNGPRN